MSSSLPIEVLSGITYLAEEIQPQLERLAWSAPGLRLIFLDRPIGWVLLSEQLDRIQGAVVATDNNCPEYRREISNASPSTIAPGVTARLIHEAVENPTVNPSSDTALSLTEGKVLKLVAENNSNKKIAQLRGTSEGVIENTLHTIYRKLDLKNRVDLVHYFYGNWHLLGENYSTRQGRG